MIAVRFNDNATGALVKITAKVKDTRAMNEVCGRAVSNVVKENFEMLNRERHRSPNKVVGFYALAAAATSHVADASGATVSVSQLGIAQRYFGGPITAGKSISSKTGEPTKYLTIPAVEDALDKKASEFGELKVLFNRGKRPFALAEPGSGKGKDRKRGRIIFWLTGGVMQSPDPTVLPTNQKMAGAAVTACKEYASLET